MFQNNSRFSQQPMNRNLRVLLLILVENCVNIGWGNGSLPVRRQATTRTDAALLSIRPLETNFSEILIKIQNFSFVKMHYEMAAILSWGRWVKEWKLKGSLSGPSDSYFNSLWPSDTIWCHETLVQEIVSSQMAPSHYPNQCWLFIREVKWHSSEDNFSHQSLILTWE